MAEEKKVHEIADEVEALVYKLSYLAIEMTEALEEDHPEVIYTE